MVHEPQTLFIQVACTNFKPISDPIDWLSSADQQGFAAEVWMNEFGQDIVTVTKGLLIGSGNVFNARFCVQGLAKKSIA